MANPVPSDKIVDFKSNSETLDDVVNSNSETVNTRTGKTISTHTGWQSQVDQLIQQGQIDIAKAIRDAGYQKVGTFESGATLTDFNQALEWAVADGGDGNWYRWDGAYNKVVPASSTPAGTGGVGAGAWINVTDLTLRSELPQLIALGGRAVFSSTSDLVSMTTKDGQLDAFTLEAMRAAGTKFKVESFYGDGASGSFEHFLLNGADKSAQGYDGAEGFACFQIDLGGGALDLWSCLVVKGKEINISELGLNSSSADVTPYIEAGFNLAEIVYVPPMEVPLITACTMPKNTRLYGGLRCINSQFVSGADDPTQHQNGTTFLVRDNGQIIHDASCEIDHLCFRYDEQNYEILTGGADTDGLTNFVEYPPTIEYQGDSDGDVYVHHILILGAYRFYYSDDSINLEKPTFEYIRGWCLRTGFEIGKSADMVKFYDIHFNPKVMFQLPEYNRNPATNYTNEKYTNHMQMFKFGRVDGGYIDNCFIYACQTFCRIRQAAGVSGGSIRISNSAADICNTFLSVDQTQRGFGFAIDNCWITPAINKIVKPDGTYATVKSGWIRITDDGANKPENVHVEMSDCKTSAGGVTLGFTNSAAYEQQFHFSANTSSTNNSMIVSNCHFDEISGWSSGDPISSLVTGVTDNLNHICSFDHCFGRFALTDVYTKFSDDKKSAGTSYSREIAKHRTYMAGSHLTADFSWEGREFGDPNRYAFEMMLKDAGGNILIEQLLKGGNVYRYLTATNGNTVFPIGTYNEGHIVIGPESTGIHIFRNGNDLRISIGNPSSATDGALLGTAT